MGFGQPRPSPKKLFVSTNNCTGISLVGNTINFMNNSTSESALLPALKDVGPPTTDDNYFYLYRISYTWYAFIGFALTIIVGTMTSILFRRFYYVRTGGHVKQLDSNLFITPIRKKMSLQHQGRKDHKVKTFNINDQNVAFHEVSIHDQDNDGIGD